MAIRDDYPLGSLVEVSGIKYYVIGFDESGGNILLAYKENRNYVYNIIETFSALGYSSDDLEIGIESSGIPENRFARVFNVASTNITISRTGKVVDSLTVTGQNGISLSDPQFDDLRVAANNIQISGTNPALWGRFAGDGVSGADYSVLFDGVTGIGDISSNAALTFNEADFSVGLWVKPDPGVLDFQIVVGKLNEWFVAVFQGSVYFVLFSTGTTFTGPVLGLGDKNSVVVVSNDTGTNTEVEIYVNNTLEASNSFPTRNSDTDQALTVGAYSGTVLPYKGNLDELRIWDKALDTSEISTFWNDGFGTEGNVAVGNLKAGYHFNENTGSTADNFEGTAALDVSLSGGFSWDVGLLQGSESRGVYTLIFGPNDLQEVFFSIQIPHSYVEGTDVYPHIHWEKLSSGSGDVLWGFEYVWTNVGGDRSDTSTLESTSIMVGSGDESHLVTSFSEIDGTGKEISSMLSCRLYRDPTDAQDTFNGNVALYEFDLHFQINTFGSRERFIK